MNITLFPISQKKEAPQKILFLCKKLIAKKIYLQIICPNQETVNFIDKLLWTDPLTFVPHTTQLPSPAPIYISTEQQLTPPFTHALWLLPSIPPEDLGALHLYDFDDKSSEVATNHTQARYHHYKEKGLRIALLA